MEAEFVSQKVYLKQRGRWNPREAAFSMPIKNGFKQHEETKDIGDTSPGSPFKEGLRCSPAAGRGVHG